MITEKKQVTFVRIIISVRLLLLLSSARPNNKCLCCKARPLTKRDDRKGYKSNEHRNARTEFSRELWDTSPPQHHRKAFYKYHNGPTSQSVLKRELLSTIFVCFSRAYGDKPNTLFKHGPVSTAGGFLVKCERCNDVV